MELNKITLCKSDFRDELAWLSLCRKLDLPLNTEEVELGCLVWLARRYQTCESYGENNNTMVVKTEEEKCIDKQEQ